jgi:hypothetical protein
MESGVNIRFGWDANAPETDNDTAPIEATIIVREPAADWVAVEIIESLLAKVTTNKVIVSNILVPCGMFYLLNIGSSILDLRGNKSMIAPKSTN